MWVTVASWVGAEVPVPVGRVSSSSPRLLSESQAWSTAHVCEMELLVAALSFRLKTQRHHVRRELGSVEMAAAGLSLSG